MIWDNNYVTDEENRLDIERDYRAKSLKIAIKYVKWCCNRKHRKEVSYTEYHMDEFAGGETVSMNVNIKGYDLTMCFLYRKTDKKFELFLNYYVEFPLNGLTKDFVDKLNLKYKNELKNSVFGELRLYDEEAVAEKKEERKKYDPSGSEDQYQTNIRPCLVLPCWYYKSAGDVKQNMEDMVESITKNGSVIEKIKNEIELKSSNR